MIDSYESEKILNKTDLLTKKFHIRTPFSTVRSFLGIGASGRFLVRFCCGLTLNCDSGVYVGFIGSTAFLFFQKISFTMILNELLNF